MKRSFLWIVLFLATLISSAAGASDSVLIKGNPETKVGYYNPVWSPDGRAIAYVRGTDFNVFPFEGDIYLARQVHGKWMHKLLIPHAYSPIWSKSGLLAYAGEKGLMLYDPKVGKSVQLTTNKPDNKPNDSGYDDMPSEFSPDNRFLAYERAFYEWGELRVYDLKLHHDLGIRIDDESGWSFSPDGSFFLGTLSPNEKKFGSLSSSRLMLWDLNTLKWHIILRKYNTPEIDWLRGRNNLWVYIDDPWAQDLPEYRPEDIKPPKGKGWYRLNLTTHRLTKGSHESSGLSEKRYAYVTNVDVDHLKKNLYVVDTLNHQKYLISRNVAESGNFHQFNWNKDWSQDYRSLAYVTVSGDIMIHRFDVR